MREISIPVPDGVIAALRWDDAGSNAPLIHFAHATGLNARTYRRLLEPLAGRYRIVASDLRGHGGSTLRAEPEELRGWEQFEDDLEALIEALGEPALLAGHSIGATVSGMLAARRPELALGVAMAEPSFIPFADAARVDEKRRQGLPFEFELARIAGKRRSRWDRRDEVRSAYLGRGMFATWPEAWLDDYLDGGLVVQADGSVELACAPAWEQATFGAVTTEIWRRLPRYRGALTVVRGTVSSTIADPDAAALAELAPQARMFVYPGRSHFLPMEAPELVHQAIDLALVTAEISPQEIAS